MKRTIIKQGNKSYTVTLPVKWIRNFGLNGGDEIELEEKGTELLLKTTRSIASEPKEIDVRGINETFIKRMLSAIHKSGYDEVKVIYDKPETAIMIDSFLKDILMGYEIVSQKPDHLIIKCVSEALEEEFENVLRRSFLVTINLAENLVDVLKDNKPEQLKPLITLETTNTRLTTICERILNKRGYSDSKKTTFIYTIEWQLEKIADTYKEIINWLLSRQNKKVTSDELLLLQKCLGLLREYYNLFYKFSIAEISGTLDKYNEIKAMTQKLFSNKKSDPVLCSSLSKLGDQIFDLSGLVLGKAV